MATLPTYPPFDVAATSSALAAGRQVRVGILPTHQFPEGGAGRVRNIGDPAVAGPEFVEVEVVIGGVKDVIPFAPADLTPIKRGQAAPVAQPAARRTTTRTRRASRSNHSVEARAAEAAASGTDAEPTRVTVSGPDSAADSAPPIPAPPVSDVAVEPAAPPVRPRRPRGRPARTTPAAVRIALGTVEPDHEQWLAEVMVDGKSVGRPVPVSPAQVWTLVGQLGVPAAERAVGQALSVHRERARQRAGQLAKELAAAEAELARYPAPS